MANSNYSIDFYQERLEKLAIELRKYTKRSQMWVVIRLSTFLGIAVFGYFSFPFTLFSTLGIILGFVLFLFFVRKSAENKEQLNFVKQLIKINENEIKASHFDYSAFHNGEEYINPNHPFSYDMDVFGKGGFFQLFNRTVTKKGEQRLVDFLLNGRENRKESIEAIDELTEKLVWNQEYLAYGSNLEKEATEVGLDYINTEEFEIKSWVNIARFIVPPFSITLTALYYFSIINGYLFLIGFAVVLLLVRQTLKKSNELSRRLTQISPRVLAIRNQFQLMEKESFSSPMLSNYYNQLFEGKKNGKIGLIELSKLVKEGEYRYNILVNIFLNFYFAWDFRLLYKTNQWLKEYADNIEEWESIAYEFESLISGANFRANFSEHTSIPTISTNESEISLIQIGHPIIPLEKLVKNDFVLNQNEHFAIITGPNMAGKSTFLRSIGINFMLAKAGFHVMAEKFVFPEMNLYSSMRTSDDLSGDTSYFHAELLRLRFIMDAIENGEQVFIILDEILKGTNSKDKEEGSTLFLEKLNQLKVKGIIATHDLSLTNLASKYPSIINNYFDTEIQGDEISFDYKIQDGVAKNMNASFLLKKMGLIS